MRREDMWRGFIIVVLIIFIALNINVINSFLSFSTENTLDFGHSETIVPDAWNTTEELNVTGQAKTEPAMTNGYVFVDHWDDWPEDRITSTSEAIFKNMENGGYKVIKNDECTLSGITVSKQYFTNPSRDTDKTWNPIGVNYVFSKEDTNYTIQVHYFTKQDYKNDTFQKEVDKLIENDISNIHNNDYNALVSTVWHVVDFVGENIPH